MNTWTHCPHCGDRLTDRTTFDGHGSYCDTCDCEVTPPRCRTRDDYGDRCTLIRGHRGPCDVGELVDEETGRLLR